MRTCLFTLVFQIALTSFGQNSPSDRIDYAIEELRLPGGRLGNNVNCIVQGPDGFMWFGSHAGLHRYDGYEFTTYVEEPGDTIGETTSLTFPYIESLYWDHLNKLWISTYGEGLYRFDPVTEKFEHFAHNAKDNSTISNGLVTCATEDKEGNLWIGTVKGLNKFDRKTQTFKRYYADSSNKNSLHHDDIRNLYVDRKGTLWIGTGWAYFDPIHGALSKYDPSSDSFINYLSDSGNPGSLPSPAVRGILEDSKGNFWIGTSTGLSLMNREDGTFKKMTPGPNRPYAPGPTDNGAAVYSIHEDKGGNLWIGTISQTRSFSHLLKYDPRNQSSILMPVTTSAWTICESKDGTLWIGGSGVSGVVVKLSPKVKTYDLLRGGEWLLNGIMQSPTIQQLADYRDLHDPEDMLIDPRTGNIWMEMIALRGKLNGPDGTAFLCQIDPKSQKVKLIPLPLAIKYNLDATEGYATRGMYLDSAGGIWGAFTSTQSGVYRYDINNGTFKEYLHEDRDTSSLSSNNIVKIHMDRHGDIWVATLGAGLNRITPASGKIKKYHFNKKPDLDFPIAITDDREGNVWVGGEIIPDEDGKSALVVINPKSDHIEFKKFPFIGTHFSVRSISQNPVTGHILFSMDGNGIGFYNQSIDRFSFYDTNTGFPFENIADIVHDREGYCWIAGGENNGEYLSMDERLGRHEIIHESGSSGAVRRSGFLGPDGNVFFLSLFGWIEINPYRIRSGSNTDTTRIAFTSIFVQGEKVKPGNQSILQLPIGMSNEVILPHNVGSFLIRFSDFNFKNLDPNFQFRLYPFETNWMTTVHSASANYYRVPPGQYTFEVRRINSIGISYSQKLSVIILPPWWQTWWAYTGYTFIFAFGIFLTHRYQKARVIRIERERTRDRELAQALEVERAYQELKSTQAQLIQSEKMASLGEMTAGIAHEIQNPLNFVNNFSEINKELIGDLKSEIRNGNIEKVGSIAGDIEANEEKIMHHGKRADAIVKSMLQHSRSSSGQKELTDINALCDEYLRLAYHGLRAKD
ncbi:MAG: hypothetical protein JST14_19025, partial [Bacteroidetes bacterium]|nr:hypothetical protein [Bacteroidota bacterium]